MSMTALGGGNGSSNSSSHHSTTFNNPADLGVDDIHLSSHHLSLLEAKDEVLQVLKSDLMEALNKEVKSLDEDNWMFEGPRSRVNLISNPGRSYATRNA